MKPLLSIVIPTKDRYEYLKQLIDLIQGFESNEIEIVIQDNTKDNSEIINFIQLRSSDLLRYSHEPLQLPISENSDRAILNSNGEYICFLGDDDGTTKEILEVVKWMKKTNISAAITAPVYYQWPDAYEGNGSILRIPTTMTGEYMIKRVDIILNRCIRDGMTWRDGLPGVYHGIVKRESLDKIYKKCGTFFPGPSPDIANCVATCMILDKYGYINRPIIINGVGKHHGGGEYQKDISLRKLPFLPDNIIEAWECKIPRAWTATTIWCESSVKALRAMGREDLIKKINFNYMYAVFASLYRKNIPLILDLHPNYIKLGGAVCRRIKNVVLKKIRKRFVLETEILHDIKDIHQASLKISEIKLK